MPTEKSSVGAMFFNTHLFGSRLPVARALAELKGDRLEYRDLQRAELIASELVRLGAEQTGPGLVGLCEVWDDDLAEILIHSTSLVFPHSYRPAKFNQAGNLLGSGLLLLSKHPFVRTPEFGAYWKESGSLEPILGGEADAHSQKGFVRAIILLPSGERVAFFITHLQAGAENKYQDIRRTQFKQIAFYLKNTRTYFPGVPIVMMGDLNVAAETSSAAASARKEYTDALKTLGLKDAFRIIYPNVKKDRGYTSDPKNTLLRLFDRDSFAKQRLDYVLVSRKGMPETCDVVPFRLDDPINGDGGDVGAKIHDLSDHYGIRAQLAVA